MLQVMVVWEAFHCHLSYDVRKALNYLQNKNKTFAEFLIITFRIFHEAARNLKWPTATTNLSFATTT